MSAKMSDIEKLARDICWAQWVGKKPAGMTKAAYWLEISRDARDEYMRDARWIVSIVRKLKPLRILQMIRYVEYPGTAKRSRT